MEALLSIKECTICESRAAYWRHSQEKYLKKAELELARFQKQFKAKKARLLLTEHAEIRQWQRAFSFANVREAILNGFPIYRYYNSPLREVKILVMSYVKTGTREYRPMHVVVGFHERTPEIWTVITVYDPSVDKQKQWNDRYDQKICFCDETCDETLV
ncbi:DUF4258 domain-containing protein [Brevibacillus marinus]|uniref:DUF4258 domain-containing protein n=1 Tax=Brevibacillus marinus TaxID=2496837 RepID=UPI000F843DFB|nr:DUF4258 domain-containing protein [Brevibacillus marinus]